MSTEKLRDLVENEDARRRAFPVAEETIYLGHAGVCALPSAATGAMREFLDRSERGVQELPWAYDICEKAREDGAALLGAKAEEIALLGPTSVGLSLVAAGLPWEPGDEVVYYADDYPSNVYPWSQLAGRGVTAVPLAPPSPGVIVWDLIEALLTKKTKLVALASCHFLSGYRIDIDTIGRELHARNILFCVDGIQTVGAFPTPVEHVDFLSADSHKWMLGPAAAGIFYVDKSKQDLLKPILLGASNVHSPDFIAQDDIGFIETAKRYEPGILNLPGIIGMQGSMQLLLDLGIDAVAARLLELRRAFLEGLRPLGYRLYLDDRDQGPEATSANRSAIIALSHPGRDIRPVYGALGDAGVVTSFRRNRAGEMFIRLSPHFYNTFDEVDRVVELMK